MSNTANARGQVKITPFSAHIIFPLSPEYSSAWSPGLDLHIRAEGATEAEASQQLANNLLDLAARLIEKAQEIEP